MVTITAVGMKAKTCGKARAVVQPAESNHNQFGLVK
jgi:hypothetical protein